MVTRQPTKVAGAWSYGYCPTAGAFTLYTNTSNSFGSGTNSWSLPGQCCPMVTKNNTGSTYTYPNAPSVVQPADVLNLHPGPNNERSIVRWSSPSSGTYAVSGRFEGIDTDGTTTDVLITKNGTTLFTGVINGYGNQLPFSLPVTVAAGDILEFSVGYGANGSYNGDSTGLAVTITDGGAGGGSSEAIHWLVTDHLGTPRMLIDQTGTLATIKRHDYLPFGEELFAGTGGRSAANGYGCPPTEQGCTGDKVRQQFTSKERDVETGFDFFGARYYASIQGRFSSADPLLSSGERGNPQTWNRYVYVLNNPLRLIDPNGLDDAEANEQDKQKQVVKPLEDKIIQKRLKEIQSNAQPLAAGERPRPTTVEQIQGEQTILQNATVVIPEGQGEIANGYMQPIALVVLDQGGNIITDPNLSVTEYAFPTNEDAKALYDANKAETTNGVPVQQQPNGVFYDLQVRGFNPSLKPMDIQTKQDLVIKSGTTNLFMIQGNKIRMNDANKSITFTPGTLRKFVN